MFGKKTESTHTGTMNNRPVGSKSHNSLVEGTRLEGDVYSNTDFRLDGVFIGNLTCQARVIIGPSGNFDGAIQCENAIVEGKFSGKLRINDVLEVKEGAHIEGEVITNKLVVHSGSVFDVNCSMGNAPIDIPTIDEKVDSVPANGIDA